MRKSQVLLIGTLALLFMTIVACSGPPETQVYIVVSPTHHPPTLTALALSGAPVATEVPTAVPTTPASQVTEQGMPSQASPNPFPTPLVSQIQVAEQVFQGGRMFWLQPNREIWVMVNADATGTYGTWMTFQDTFAEGELEIDPEITPPVNGIQPRRGFGKLWRENQEIRDALGWATTPEFGLVTTYQYQPGGYLDSNGAYVAGPGTHLLTSLGNETFAFDESNLTWRLVDNNDLAG